MLLRVSVPELMAGKPSQMALTVQITQKMLGLQGNSRAQTNKWDS